MQIPHSESSKPNPKLYKFTPHHPTTSYIQCHLQKVAGALLAKVFSPRSILPPTGQAGEWPIPEHSSLILQYSSTRQLDLHQALHHDLFTKYICIMIHDQYLHYLYHNADQSDLHHDLFPHHELVMNPISWQHGRFQLTCLLILFLLVGWPSDDPPL